MKYFVTWEIDVDAESPREAAQKALNIQRDENSLATVFKVYTVEEEGSGPESLGVQETTVDLSSSDELLEELNKAEQAHFGKTGGQA